MANNNVGAGENTPPKKPPRKTSSWEFYVAGALGALALTCSDCIKNENAAAVSQISETIKTQFVANFDYAGLAALLFIVLMGIGLCFVHSPTTRVGAFYRGLSVFAVLGVAFSGGGDKGGLQNQFPGKMIKPQSSIGKPHIGSLVPGSFNIAYAGTIASAQDTKAPEAVRPLGRAVISLNFPPKSEAGQITVAIRDAKTMRIVGVEKIKSSNFTVQQPIGPYFMEISAPNFRNSQTKIFIKEDITAYAIAMQPSAVPRSFQRLVMGNQSLEAHKLPAPERYLQIGLSDFRFKNYAQAVVNYDKYLASDPKNVKVLAYKGYALFRMQKYPEAEAVLNKALAINPHYLWTRLNLAKTLCAINKKEEACEILLGDPPLKPTDLKIATKDFELRDCCGDVYGKVVVAYKEALRK